MMQSSARSYVNKPQSSPLIAPQVSAMPCGTSVLMTQQSKPAATFSCSNGNLDLCCSGDPFPPRLPASPAPPPSPTPIFSPTPTPTPVPTPPPRVQADWIVSLTTPRTAYGGTGVTLEMVEDDACRSFLAGTVQYLETYNGLVNRTDYTMTECNINSINAPRYQLSTNIKFVNAAVGSPIVEDLLTQVGITRLLNSIYPWCGTRMAITPEGEATLPLNPVYPEAFGDANIGFCEA